MTRESANDGRRPFLLRLANKAFVAAKGDRTRASPRLGGPVDVFAPAFLALLFGGIGIGLVFLTAHVWYQDPRNFSGNSVFTGVALFWNGFIWPMVALLGKRLLRLWRIQRKGRLLPGEVIGTSWRHDSEDGGSTLEISYKLVGPNGELFGKADDPAGKARHSADTPADGTPLAVLYLDDDTFEPL